MGIEFDDEVSQPRYITSYNTYYVVSDQRCESTTKRDGDKAGVRTHEPDKDFESTEHHMMTTLTKITVKSKLTKTVVEELIHLWATVMQGQEKLSDPADQGLLAGY